MINIQSIIDKTVEILKTHELEKPGEYTRWLWQNASNDRELGINEYGCADAANILYMIGMFPTNDEERKSWISTLQNLQDKETGLFVEKTHHYIHTTAHCIAALELFDKKAKYPLKALEKYKSKENLYDLLNNLDWDNNPWTASHEGAGIYAAMVLQGEANDVWEKWYFDWLYEEADPCSGFWKKGSVKPILNGDSFAGKRTTPSVFPHLASTFHYLFNHEYAHKPLRYPEKMIDTCLDIYNNGLWPTLGKNVSFAEIDWVYCLNRAVRQCNYKYVEVKETLYKFAKDYVAFLDGLDPNSHDGLNDLHTLFGAICALCELQAALPGRVVSKNHLKLVLDRRPFI